MQREGEGCVGNEGTRGRTAWRVLSYRNSSLERGSLPINHSMDCLAGESRRDFSQYARRGSSARFGGLGGGGSDGWTRASHPEAGLQIGRASCRERGWELRV